MQKINFIENKKINFNELSKIYRISSKKNQHANFGPIYEALCKKFKEITNLPKNKDCLFCSSGTIALLTASNYFKKLKKGKFVTSNYTFFSSNLNHLSNCEILDTNEKGVVDEKIINNKFKKSWATLIITNLFNQQPNFDNLYKFTKKKKINLIIDNSNNLLDRPYNYKKMNLIEVISFHHTKPWGFGEGGVLIFNKEYKKELKNLLNFGANKFILNKKYATNGKISELSCAALLHRLNKFKIWSKQYLDQKKRIMSLLMRYFKNIEILHNPTHKSPINYLPVLSKKKITQKKLNQFQKIAFRKYYLPISSNEKFKNSNKLFEKIVCIPCHSELNKISDKELISILKKILK